MGGRGVNFVKKMADALISICVDVRPRISLTLSALCNSSLLSLITLYGVIRKPTRILISRGVAVVAHFPAPFLSFVRTMIPFGLRRPALTSAVAMTPIPVMFPSHTRGLHRYGPAVVIPGDSVLETTTIGGTATFFNLYQNVIGKPFPTHAVN